MISDTTATPSSARPDVDTEPCRVRSKLVDLMPPMTSLHENSVQEIQENGYTDRNSFNFGSV